jgi:hypothetical protein
MMSDGTDRHMAMDTLRAPAGPELVERVTAERLAHPHLRAVDVEEAAQAERITALEAQLAEERAGRTKAEDAVNEMAMIVASVRTELAEVKQARETAESTAAEMAALIAKEHERVRKAEEELRLAWAQVPMIEQRDVDPGKSLARRARRALRG